MKYSNIFTMINSAPYKTAGDFVDYCIIYDEAEQEIFLLFQPSNQKKDWVNNFNFPIQLYKHSEHKFFVARGWGNAYRSCNDIIMAELLEMCEQKTFCRVIVAGWSYGGAMAQLAAEDFHFRTGLFASVVTFGSPKPIFGLNSLSYFRNSVLVCTNFEHINDCVPLLPPFTGYASVNPVSVGKKKLFGIFNPWKYHCAYGDETLYEGL